jgi:succinate dehydrogenase / fumarate reductase, cytochrome b subunit
MSSIAMSGAGNRPALFYQSVVGKKIIMAVTGIMLFGFVMGHMIGNLQVFIPQAADGSYALDHYAEKLRSLGPGLWVIRLVLLTAAMLHGLMAFQLWLLKREARPLDYMKKASTVSTYASRTMYVSGPLVLLYLIYHLMHFTIGNAHPDFQFGQVHRNLVIGFSNPLVSFVYIAANILLATHIYHGVWSMLQTLGIAHPAHTPRLRVCAKLFALLIGAGFCIVPIAVLTGVVK